MLTAAEMLETNPSMSLEEARIELVKSNGMKIVHIDNPSEEEQLAAVKQNGYAIKYISDPSIKVQLAAIENAVDAINWIKDPPEEVQLFALQRSKFNMIYIECPTEVAQLEWVNWALSKLDDKTIDFYIKLYKNKFSKHIWEDLVRDFTIREIIQ